MFPLIIPVQKRFDPSQVDGMLSRFSQKPGLISCSLTVPVAEDGIGTAKVDGIPLSACEYVNAAGHSLLLVPVGEVARDYNRSYQVILEGFCAKGGKRFPKCSFTLKTEKRREPDPRYAEHDEQALNAAREGMVLLKNEGGVLPLKPDSVLNIFGAAQHQYRITASGASLINPRWRPMLRDAIADHSSFEYNTELAAFYSSDSVGTPDQELLRRAKEKSDVAIILLSRQSGEGQDNRPVKGQYYLSDNEESMIASVCGAFEKTVVILNTGYPIDMRWTEQYNIKTVLYTGFAGMLSSYALMELLDGRTNPSGRLPDTWTWDWKDNPVSRNMPTLGEADKAPEDLEHGVRIYYEEDIYLGYRYFDTFQKNVAFSFGHGLSYTKFSHVLSGFTQTAEGISLDITVANEGQTAGKEVVQLYLSAPDGRLEKPAHVLIGFEKTKLLAPGECETLQLLADNLTMASFDEESARYVLERGTYRLFVGNIGNLTQVKEFELTEEKSVKQVQHLGCPVEDFKRLSKAKPTVDGSKSSLTSFPERIATAAQHISHTPYPLPAYTGKTIKWEDLLRDRSLLEKFVAQMTTQELCKLNVCAGARWMPWQDGVTGYTHALKKYGLPSFSVSDANAGWNLNKPNIGFPASSVIAATFNKEIAYTVGRVIAEEGHEHGVVVNLGPGMNLHRSILNGRHPEYFGEDPLLVGIMAGYHGKGLEEHGVGCCYKHMFCNNSDLCRKGSHSVVSERALRELYFRSFELAFSIHKPSTVMTSYNALNGLYPAENAQLIQDLIRGEWEFDGWIMSDWDSYDSIDAVEMVKAGNCWLTSGGKKWVKVLETAAKEGRLPRSYMEDNVRWVIRTYLDIHDLKHS